MRIFLLVISLFSPSSLPSSPLPSSPLPSSSALPPDRKHSAVVIYNKYIKVDAPCMIGLPMQQRENIEVKMDSGAFGNSLFRAAQTHVLQYLTEVALPEFYAEDNVAVTADNVLTHLSDILTNPQLRQRFLKFSRNNPAENVFNFFIAVERFRLLPASQPSSPGSIIMPGGRYSPHVSFPGKPRGEQWKAAQAIYDKYITSGSDRELSTPPEVKRNIAERLQSNDIGCHLFQDAQKHVLSIMRVDILPKFLQMIPNSQMTANLESADADSKELTLATIFKDKDLTKAFLGYCKRIFSEENALFYLEVEKFKGIPPDTNRVSVIRDEDSYVAHDRIRRHSLLFQDRYRSTDLSRPPNIKLNEATDIYDKYVKPGSLYEVSSPPQLKDEVKRILESKNIQLNMFDRVQEHVLNVIHVEFFPKYLETVPAEKTKWLRRKKKKKTSMAALRDLFDDDKKNRDFAKFCKSLHSEENIEFFHAVERFKSNTVTPLTVIEEDDADDDSDYEAYANDPVPRDASVEFKVDFGRERSETIQRNYQRTGGDRITTVFTTPTGVRREVKSILSPLTKRKCEVEAELCRRRLLREARLEEHVAILKQGEVAIKYNSNFKPTRRRFQVSADGTYLMWGKPNSKNLNNKLSLYDVLAMFYGPFSNRFRYFDCSIGKAWLCMVIVFEERTMDIVFENVAQLTRWFLGLQHLAPLNSSQMSPGGLIWARANMKIDRMAFFDQTTPNAVWASLLYHAREAVNEENQKRTARAVIEQVPVP
jgi:Regulator of G protein signaling domain